MTATMIGFEPRAEENVYLSLGQTFAAGLPARARRWWSSRRSRCWPGGTKCSMRVAPAPPPSSPAQVAVLPSIKRSTRDLTRLDPAERRQLQLRRPQLALQQRLAGRLLFQQSVRPRRSGAGGQSNAEPVPYDAVEQVQVSIAPFDVREGGFTGANVNTVTKSGTNDFRGSIYTFCRNEKLLGNKRERQGGCRQPRPDVSPVGRFRSAGRSATSSSSSSTASSSGPTIRAPISWPGTGSARLRRLAGQAGTMDAIRQRMIDEYHYDPGPYEGYIHETDNNKLIAKLDWNINESNNLTFRYNYLDAKRDLGPHPFVLSFNNTGRGPNESSLPFQKSGYAINNSLHSFACELNSRTTWFANRFFASYNRFRDFREPFSEAFPTVEIGEGGVTYTTLGPRAVLDPQHPRPGRLPAHQQLQPVPGPTHALPSGPISRSSSSSIRSTFSGTACSSCRTSLIPGRRHLSDSLDEFFAATDPGIPNQKDLNCVGTGPFKGENIGVGSSRLYAQDEFLASTAFNLTFGVRLDFPMYFTDPVDNPFSRALDALDENGKPETVDQSKLPGRQLLFSPRVGFNWNAVGERRPRSAAAPASSPAGSRSSGSAT